MEFILFLGSRELEILNLVRKANYKLEENTPYCLLGDEYFGFLKRNQKRIVICTNNAKRKGGYFLTRIKKNEDYERTSIYIKKALRHEAVHVAQQCNDNNLIELEKIKKLKINPYKLKALEGSTKISGKKDHEYQAYIMEDRPKLVIKALKKYCL
tara:strand:+ start:154 stop:618 length:465 start_codon:yes stop_codon:yes gene_type:complete